MLRCRLELHWHAAVRAPLTGNPAGRPPCRGGRHIEALMALSDEEVTRILAVAIGETLMADSAVVDAAGTKLGVRMAQAWPADDALFDLVRDREAVDAILVEVAGRAVADANLSATLKVRKTIVRDCLEGPIGAPGRGLDARLDGLPGPVLYRSRRPRLRTLVQGRFAVPVLSGAAPAPCGSGLCCARQPAGEEDVAAPAWCLALSAGTYPPRSGV